MTNRYRALFNYVLRTTFECKRGEYTSDFQYYLRREIDSPAIKYIAIYITQRGDWFYDEPEEEYILIHVLNNTSLGHISRLAASYTDEFRSPF